MNTNVDYATTYFKYPATTPINDKLINKSLNRLKTELRANTSSADTDLGGGDHGYLELVLTDSEYPQTNPTPTVFAAPSFRGVLVINATATTVEDIHAKEIITKQCTYIEIFILPKTYYCVIQKTPSNPNT